MKRLMIYYSSSTVLHKLVAEEKRVDGLFIESSFCRFSCRGVDDDGHVANFVETEQLIQIGEYGRRQFRQLLNDAINVE
jgi:hypothetical protein